MTDRKKFEAWAVEPPREWSIQQNGKDQGWPHQYRAYHVQCAWEAWQAAKKDQWNKIDYSKPETWPDLRTPVIRSWANGCFGNSEPFIDHEIAFLDEDDGNVFWNIQISSEQSRRTQAVSADGQAYPPVMLSHYTHWCHAPQFGGE